MVMIEIYDPRFVAARLQDSCEAQNSKLGVASGLLD